VSDPISNELQMLQEIKSHDDITWFSEVEDVVEYLNDKHDLFDTDNELSPDTDDFLDYL
tara:strand:- start:554 stop:730 length:177 start_codon:yes stop_codon:yes gene_type:complete